MATVLICVPPCDRRPGHRVASAWSEGEKWPAQDQVMAQMARVTKKKFFFLLWCKNQLVFLFILACLSFCKSFFNKM